VPRKGDIQSGCSPAPDVEDRRCGVRTRNEWLGRRGTGNASRANGQTIKEERVSIAAKSSGRVTIVDSSRSRSLVGPSFRSLRLGPEGDLLERFLSAPLFNVPSGCEAVVFREPRLPSGFPDLVIVIWDKKKSSQWLPAREVLTREDVRVAHYMHHSGPCSDEQLKAVFTASVRKSIGRLEAAGVLRAAKATWQLQPMGNVFAAREIIAVEAKVSEWKVGLEQAVLNTWFASMSYILVPSVASRSSLFARAKALGIGVWAEDHAPIRPKKVQRLPCSYASWLFNEWAWRVSTGGKVNAEWCPA
jgi:hypothetical protein